MKCSKCNAELQPTDELRWECNACHQMCRANLPMLEQIQAQRDHGYTAAMVNCPFCGTVLDDGNETIHWNCAICGGQTTGTIKNYLKPELLEEAAEPIVEEPPAQSDFAWIDADGGEQQAPAQEKPTSSKGFFANEEAKNEFLAETTSQALGEEIPDSIFEDTFPIRKKTSVTKTEERTAIEQTESPFVESVASAPEKPMESTSTGAPAESPFVESVAGAPEKPMESTSTGAPAESPFVESVAGAPEKPMEGTSTGTPAQSSEDMLEKSTHTVGQPEKNPSTSNAPVSAVETEEETAPENSGSDIPPTSDYRYTEPPVKQVWPKVITGILGVLIAIAVVVGAFFTVNYLIAPTRQFRNAVKAADYTKAMEIYDNKIKGDQEDERIAEIAVEHYLHEAFKAWKDGTGDEAAYKKILDFAQNEMGIRTSEYELAAEATATPMPTESTVPVGDSTEEATASPEATAEVTATPEATVQSTPEITEEPAAAVTAEPDAEPTEVPAQAGDSTVTDEGEDVTAAIAKAKGYVKKKKYEKAYNYLADYKETDTTGQVEKEMSSIKKKWKSYNIKTFKALCDKLTIVYYASEKRYHIVPRGYYTNYNQICRSNNVGGIAYMDQKRKKVSITNIGKEGALSSFGKNNRANLKKFKEMIEKYPYLAKEI